MGGEEINNFWLSNGSPEYDIRLWFSSSSILGMHYWLSTPLEEFWGLRCRAFSRQVARCMIHDRCPISYCKHRNWASNAAQLVRVHEERRSTTSSWQRWLVRRNWYRHLIRRQHRYTRIDFSVVIPISSCIKKIILSPINRLHPVPTPCRRIRKYLL